MGFVLPRGECLTRGMTIYASHATLAMCVEAKTMITLQYLHDRLYNSIEAAVRDATATVVANIAYNYQRDTADEVIGPIVTNVLVELTKLPGENWLRDLQELEE